MQQNFRRDFRRAQPVRDILVRPRAAMLVGKRPLGTPKAPSPAKVPEPKPIVFDLDNPKDELQAAFTLHGSRTSTPIRKILKSAAVYSALMIAALVVGISFYNQSIGQWVVVAAGIAGVIFRLKSSLILAAAVFTLIMVIFLTLLGQPGLASNYAVYAYILLGFGTFNSIFYLRGSERQIAA